MTAAALLWRVYAAAIILFMLSPLALVVLFSFNDSALTSLPLTGVTLDWYRRLFANPSFWPALANSLLAALAAGHRHLGSARPVAAAQAGGRPLARRARRAIRRVSVRPPQRTMSGWTTATFAVSTHQLPAFRRAKRRSSTHEIRGDRKIGSP